MKHFIFSFAFLSAIIMGASSAISQESFQDQTSHQLAEKNVTSNDARVLDKRHNRSGLFYRNLRQRFSMKYPEALRVRWYATHEGLKAECIRNGDFSRVFYDKKGKWLRIITMMKGDKLPAEIATIIKVALPEYNITSAQVITNHIGTAYIVKAENCDYIRTIKIVDGQMEEMEMLKKQ